MRLACSLRQLIVLIGLYLAAPQAAFGQVSLLPHQQSAVDYLVNHPEIKGILVNHYMGTGKTFLAIGVAERLESERVIILAPRSIELHWRAQLKAFGVKKPARYEFVSYNEAPKKMKGRDLSQTIVIADEIHNLIRLVKSPIEKNSAAYSELYLSLRHAQRIVGLSGTPIYNDEYDLAYLLNLISAEQLLPFNEEEFRLTFTQVKPWPSFWRGFVSESMVLGGVLSTFLGMTLGFLFLDLWAYAAGAVLGMVIFPFFNDLLFPLERYQLRYLDVDKLRGFTRKYVSFYQAKNLSLSEFPSKEIHIRGVDYSVEQFRFFLRFVEANLSTPEFLRLLTEDAPGFTPDFVELSSSVMQKRMRDTAGSGREIGNLSFKDEDGQDRDPPKFTEILKLLRQDPAPKAVIYSNYFENGLLLFTAFLEKNGLQGKFAVLRPDEPIERQTEIVNDYNEGRTQILLLHPEITEGISLKGTQQLHVLEPVMNTTVFDQLVGRTVRYQSHTHLEASLRKVNIYLWKAQIGRFNLKNWVAKKENWFERRRELSDWSYWGRGLVQVDKHHALKLYSPDEYAYIRLSSLNENIDALKAMFAESSIESTLAAEPSP